LRSFNPYLKRFLALRSSGMRKISYREDPKRVSDYLVIDVSWLMRLEGKRV